MKRIDFYHWGCQCPINHETLELLKQYETRVQIHVFDLQTNPELAQEQNMFFPFLTVFNGHQRWKSPLTSETIEGFLNDEVFTEQPYCLEHGESIFKGTLEILTESNVNQVADGCTLGKCLKSCHKKGEFLSNSGETFYGVLNFENGKVVGGAEFLPSLKVPYPVPKDELTAFLTCVYHSSKSWDYKAYPLEALEKKLAEKYNRVIAVCDEIGTFPNGNLAWFEKQGYQDQGVIAIEEGYCKLHLVSKYL